MDNNRMLRLSRTFPIEDMTPQLNLMVQLLGMVRARYDYFIYLVDIVEGHLVFSLRDARMAVPGGVSQQFMEEVFMLSGDRITWRIECESLAQETIYLGLISG